jgi:hypothetical protein
VASLGLAGHPLDLLDPREARHDLDAPSSAACDRSLVIIILTDDRQSG